MPIQKKKHPDRNPLDLLKLSRDDIRHLYRMFANTINYQDFNGLYGVVVAFDYISDSFDAYTEEQFNEAIRDPEEILKIEILVYPMMNIGIATSSVFPPGIDTDMHVPARLILSKDSARIEIIEMTSPDFARYNTNTTANQIRACNDHLAHLKGDVLEFLRTKERKVLNKLLGGWGMLCAYVLTIIIFVSQYAGQHGPVSYIENFLLGVISFAIGVGIWIIFYLSMLRGNRVIFISERPSIKSMLQVFYARNKPTIEKAVIGLVATVIGGAILAIISYWINRGFPL